MKITALLFTTILFFSHYIVADETWLVININGYGAYSPDYVFDTDALAIKKMVITFTKDGGTVTNSDVKFIKLDDSTLIGYSSNEKGYSIVEIYQINRSQKKLQFTQTRINTRELIPNFPDKVTSMVGDIELIEVN